MTPESRYISRVVSLIALLVFLARAAVAGAAPLAEKWSDPRLTMRDGLVTWLDASRQATAAEASGKTPPQDGGLLESWLDGSGNAMHLSSPVASARPRYLHAGDAAVVRFDGEGTYLLRGNIG